MTTPISRFIHRATIATLRTALLTIVVIAAPFWQTLKKIKLR